jgi:hypothetical protein
VRRRRRAISGRGATALSQRVQHHVENRRNRHNTSVLEFGLPLAIGGIGPLVRDDTSRVDLERETIYEDEH